MHAESVTLAVAAPAADIGRERLGALFDTHERRLYRLARRLTPSADAAHDLVQETFLRAAAAPASVPSGTSKEEAWLVQVLVNLRRDQWRKAGVRQRALAEGRLDSRTAEPSHEGAVVARHAVWAALDALSPRRRAIVVLYELDGESVASIADLLGVSRITVRWHLSRGRRELRAILSPELGETR